MRLRSSGFGLGVCYFALQILQALDKIYRQNNSTKPLLVAGAVIETKMAELKQINQSELQVGKLYCDTPRLHGFNTVIMRYLGKVKGSYNFKYISGNSEYINEGDDIIRLAHYKKEPNWYWEVPKINADIIEEAVSSTCH